MSQKTGKKRAGLALLPLVAALPWAAALIWAGVRFGPEIRKVLHAAIKLAVIR